MFVMVNDGGLLDEKMSNPAAEIILCQRLFLFNLVSCGISVALFKGAEYRDSKVQCSSHHETHRLILCTSYP